MAAVSLLEASKGQPTEQQRAIIQTYASSYHPLMMAPVVNQDKGISRDWNINGYLPGKVGNRAPGSDFTSTKVLKVPMKEVYKIYGAKTEIDSYVAAAMPSEIPYQKEADILMTALLTTQHMFQGTGASNDMRGFRQMISDVSEYSGQNVASGATGGGDLPTLLKMDEFVDVVNVTDQTFIYSSRINRRYISTLFRLHDTAGQQAISWAPDDTGKQIAYYNGIPWIVLHDGTGANVLSTVETATANTGGTACSTYIVTWGETMAHLSQMGEITYKMAQDGTNLNATAFELYLATIAKIPRCIGRLSNVKNATA